MVILKKKTLQFIYQFLLFISVGYISPGNRQLIFSEKVQNY